MEIEIFFFLSGYLTHIYHAIQYEVGMIKWVLKIKFIQDKYTENKNVKDK